MIIYYRILIKNLTKVIFFFIFKSFYTVFVFLTLKMQ